MYVRRTSNCAVADPQPNSQLVQDQYGNSFRNWCVDFIRTDVNNQPEAAPPAIAENDPALRNTDTLDPQYFDNPIYASVELDGTTYYYWLTAYNGIPASQRSWADEEEARGNSNTPWAADGTSRAMAEKYTQYAFLAKPGGFSGTPPANATYVKPLPEPSVGANGGLLYYQGGISGEDAIDGGGAVAINEILDLDGTGTIYDGGDAVNADDGLHWTAMSGGRQDVKLVMYLGTRADPPAGLAGSGCADQDLFNILDLWQPVTYPDVGVPRTPSPYNSPPLAPTSGLLSDVILNPDGTIANLLLGLDQDRDLLIVTDGVQQGLFLEPSTTVLPAVAYNHNN